jgi:hypothetical protein
VVSDLHDRLDQLAGPPVAPALTTVTADLDRGRRALRKRRFGQVAGVSGVAAMAALGAVLAVGAAGTTGPTPQAGRPPAGAVNADHAVNLVAYTGTQPRGFTLDVVPQGWEVQGVDQSGLTLAPIGIADRDPRSYVGKIGIFLQKSLPDVPKSPVSVNGRPAVLATMKGDSRPGTLFIKQDSGLYLTIQVADILGWGSDRIVQFAGGVHVEPGALTTVG